MPQQATRRLIITADDFGLTESVNEAVEEGFCDGVLTTASLMVAGAAAEDAVRRARRLPALAIGLHVVLVDGPAVLRTIAPFVDPDGQFKSRQVSLSLRYAVDPRARNMLEAEIRAQFEAFYQTGLQLDHVNAHKHMQLHPIVANLIIKVGRDYGVRSIRIPAEPPLLLSAVNYQVRVSDRALYHWTRILNQQARRNELVTNDQVVGIAWTGHMTASRVIEVLPHLPPGLTELYTHPAKQKDAVLERLMPGYEHEAEAACLVDEGVRAVINQERIALTTWTREAGGA